MEVMEICLSNPIALLLQIITKKLQLDYML